MMQAEGREAMYARHRRLATATRAAIVALGLDLFAKVPADSVTSVRMPEGLAPDAVYKGLRDNANLTIAGGQDHLKGKIFRIAHLGYYDELDICTVLCALEVILRQAGYRDFELGCSVKAALPILEPGFVAA